MLAKIQRNQIRHLKVRVRDAQGQPTGELKDVLHLDVDFPEYPDLPTYGITVDFPIDKKKVKDAVKALAQKAMTQIEQDELIRNQLGNEILEFEVEV